MKSTQNIFEFRVYDLSSQQNRVSNSVPRQRNSRQASPAVLSASSIGLADPTAFVEPASISNSTAKDASTNSLYCAACKKKFNNASTFANHQQTEKHRKNAKMSGKRPPPRQQISNTHQHPAVQGALASLKKAKAIMQKDPAVAATVMWNIAKDIAEHGDDTTTRSALEGALDCMERMNADKALRGTKGAPASWTARTLLKTMLDCRMALARLEPATGRAGTMYLDALGEFLGIESKALHGLAQSRDPVSLDAVASKLNESIPRKFGNTEDVGQAVSTIEEVASGLLSFSGGQHEDPAIWTGVALYFLLHSFATTKGAPDTAYRAVLTAGEAFKALGLEYLQCDCALVLIDKHWQQNAAKFTAAQAITRSLEMGDLVRAQSILNKTKERWSDPWIQYLAKVVTRSVDSDALWLEFDARDEWTHVCSDSVSLDSTIRTLVDNCLGAVLADYAFYIPVAAR